MWGEQRNNPPDRRPLSPYTTERSGVVMEELIKIEEKDGKKVVSARELYRELELAPGQFSRWANKYILENEYAVDGDDWVGVDTNVEGNRVQDFALSIDFVKKLCMLSKTAKGEEVRDYFLSCEKKLSTVAMPTHPETLRLYADTLEREQALLLENTEMKPKADFYDQVIGSEAMFEMGQVAKLINVRGYGRNNLFEFLRENKVLKAYSTEPFQKYVDMGWFKLIEVKWQHPKTAETMLSLKTMVYQKGLDGIRKMLTK